MKIGVNETIVKLNAVEVSMAQKFYLSFLCFFYLFEEN